jgi:hypothetical protein
VIETEENKRPMENYYRDQDYYTKLLKKKGGGKDLNHRKNYQKMGR